MTDNAKIVKIVVVTVSVVVAVIAIIVGTSFSDLEYYQIGFKQRKSTRSVDTSRVYTMGHYLVGPDYTFKAFKADAHVETMDNVAIFTSDKLEVWITCKFQYYLRPEELILLHENYDIYYEDIISSNALDALKVSATGYSTDEFITQRARVEAAMFKAVRERLGGVCCERDCTERDDCVEGCKSQDECADSDRGLFVSVKFFQMQSVSIPADVAERYLRALVIQEETEKAGYDQQAAIVERKTEALVQAIKNEAAEVSQNATAQADLVRAWADANATAIVEKARIEGLKGLYDKLGLSSEDYKNSFEYMRAIKNMDNAHISVDFNQLISLGAS